MPHFDITIAEFAVLVHRPAGVTVLFPAGEHTLILTAPDGRRYPVARGASILLADLAGKPLAPAPTRAANRNQFVFELHKAIEKPVTVPQRMLDGPVDRARLNGRCTLTGGEIVEHESSAGPKDWDFRTIGRRPVTDVVTYRREIGATERVILQIDKFAVPIRAGERIRLSNRPAIGGTPSEFSQLDEFTAMCGVFDEQPEPFPVTLQRPTRRTRIGALVTFPDAEELRGADKVSAICSLVSDI